MKKTLLAAAFIAAMAPLAAFGQLDRDKLYVGGGVGWNSSGQLRGSGINAFLGHDLPELTASYGIEEFVYSAEVGVFYTGTMTHPDRDISRWDGGIQASGVASRGWHEVAPEVSLLLRLGLATGQRTGLIWGLGTEYAIDRRLGGRLEYVSMAGHNSVRLGAAYRF